MLYVLMLIIGIVFLVKCADYFVEGSSNLAKAFGIPTLIIGLTIVAFGTSAPELAVSVSAALSGSNAISIGNAVGSNLANSLLILGLCGIFNSLKAKDDVRKRDFPYYLLSALVLAIITGDYFLRGETTGYITRANGMILLCFLAIYMVSLITNVTNAKMEEKEDKVIVEKRKIKVKDFLYIIGGIIGIAIGGQLTVNGATGIARAIGISETVIALTIVAIGTSLPELVTSVIATRKGETDIAIGNVIGSNIFNILFILGITSIITPLSLDLSSFMDIIFMLLSSILVFIMLQKNKRIGRKKGICMLAMYVVYIAYILCR